MSAGTNNAWLPVSVYTSNKNPNMVDFCQDLLPPLNLDNGLNNVQFSSPRSIRKASEPVNFMYPDIIVTNHDQEAKTQQDYASNDFHSNFYLGDDTDHSLRFHSPFSSGFEADPQSPTNLAAYLDRVDIDPPIEESSVYQLHQEFPRIDDKTLEELKASIDELGY